MSKTVAKRFIWFEWDVLRSRVFFLVPRLSSSHGNTHFLRCYHFPNNRPEVTPPTPCLCACARLRVCVASIMVPCDAFWRCDLAMHSE